MEHEMMNLVPTSGPDTTDACGCTPRAASDVSLLACRRSAVRIAPTGGSGRPPRRRGGHSSWSSRSRRPRRAVPCRARARRRRLRPAAALDDGARADGCPRTGARAAGGGRGVLAPSPAESDGGASTGAGGLVADRHRAEDARTADSSQTSRSRRATGCAGCIATPPVPAATEPAATPKRPDGRSAHAVRLITSEASHATSLRLRRPRVPGSRSQPLGRGCPQAAQRLLPRADQRRDPRGAAGRRRGPLHVRQAHRHQGRRSIPTSWRSSVGCPRSVWRSSISPPS